MERCVCVCGGGGRHLKNSLLIIDVAAVSSARSEWIGARISFQPRLETNRLDIWPSDRVSFRFGFPPSWAVLSQHFDYFLSLSLSLSFFFPHPRPPPFTFVYIFSYFFLLRANFSYWLFAGWFLQPRFSPVQRVHLLLSSAFHASFSLLWPYFISLKTEERKKKDEIKIFFLSFFFRGQGRWRQSSIFLIEYVEDLLGLPVGDVIAMGGICGRWWLTMIILIDIYIYLYLYIFFPPIFVWMCALCGLSYVFLFLLSPLLSFFFSLFLPFVYFSLSLSLSFYLSLSSSLRSRSLQQSALGENLWPSKPAV